MNRIKEAFKNKDKKILSVYFTAAYPHLEDTSEIIKELVKNAVDLIEIGIPFSDPIADGEVIQHSNHVAIKNGINIKKIFSQIKDIRKTTQVPLVMMGYFNPILKYGFENFCYSCQQAGIDGMIIPDLPLREYLQNYKPIVEKHNLEFIFLITPETSEERVRLIDENTNGFIYMVSSASTTGVQKTFSDKIAYFERINAMNLKNPRLIGFGISNKETKETAFEYSSGAIVGSAFIKALEEAKDIESGVKLLLERLNQ